MTCKSSTFSPTTASGKSDLWNKMRIFHLLTNNRIRLGNFDEAAQEYADWILQMGNGSLKTFTMDDKTDFVDIPRNLCIEANIDEVINFVFPDIVTNFADNSWMSGRAVLATKNKTCQELNDQVAKMLPGEEFVCTSADELIVGSSDDDLNIPVEYLNTIVASGMPHHELILKKGMPVLLLRNLDPINGLCNGTRFIGANKLYRIHFLPSFVIS